MKSRTPNWNKWRLIPDARLWEIVALSLDIEPSKVDISEHSWMADDLVFGETTEFKDRLDILIANINKHPSLNPTSIIMGSPSSCKLIISNVGAWAESVGWRLPPDFPRNGSEATLPDNKPINPASHESVLSETEKTSLLKIIAALAFHGYKYPERGALAEMVRDFQTNNCGVTENTLRKYLEAASQYLPAKSR